MSALDLTKPVATVAAPARDTAAQWIPAGEENYRAVKEDRDTLAAQLKEARELLIEMQGWASEAFSYTAWNDKSKDFLDKTKEPTT